MPKTVPGEEILEGQTITQVDKVRDVVASTYAFIRSAEINKTIASFTLDHYIDEAKRDIKGADRNAIGAVADIRPSKLDALLDLEKQFSDSFEVIEALAKKADEDGVEGA